MSDDLDYHWAKCAHLSLRTHVSALGLLVAIASPITARKTPEDAERFTHLVAFNLADLPSFDELANKHGKNPIAQSGDAGNYDARVCYRTQTKAL